MEIIDQPALAESGFAVTQPLYTPEEVLRLIQCVGNADREKETFRRSAELFAIRQFLREIPEAKELIFNDRLKALIRTVFGSDYFVVKSIYFDKPPGSNWYVARHQDLTISVDRKLPVEGFGPWTTKQGQFAVQPPMEILENIYTVRIHLDDTNSDNGALEVVPGSHRKGIYRPETIDWSSEQEVTCAVDAGCAMIMRPLLLHRSSRSANGMRRRVIHLELADKRLPEGLEWSEKMLV